MPIRTTAMATATHGAPRTQATRLGRPRSTRKVQSFHAFVVIALDCQPDFTYIPNTNTRLPTSQEFPGVPYGPTDFHCERALNSWTDPLVRATVVVGQ